MIRATICYLFLATYLLVMAPVGLCWTALTGNPRSIYRLARACIGFAIRLCGIQVQRRGAEKLEPGQTYLFLSNHQGNLDGPVLFHATGRDLRALVKQEMMRVPLLATVLRQVRFVPIDRSDPVKARMSIAQGVLQLRDGHSFFAFPEGTRSRDGRLGVFKKGAFIMAIEAGVPIVPVTINNSRGIQPPGTYRISPGTVEIVFHPPVPTENYTLAERDALIEMTRAAISSALTGAGAGWPVSSP